ncbi:DUF4760 domain-containing protein [Reyranella sp.]|uniref:DUF4760 domain-containing protein n=1 Tax=Reyranella sp. TaxID=1929291 RepID=UPI003D0D9FA0
MRKYLRQRQGPVQEPAGVRMLTLVIIASLLAVGLLVVTTCFLVLNPTRFPKLEHERLRTVANVVAAGAAVAIPIVVFQAAERSRTSEMTTARDTRTLEIMNGSEARLSALLIEKRRLDQNANREGHSRFEYEYISQSDAVSSIVDEILNEHETICIGVNQGMLSYRIVWAIRGDALLATFENYDAYIGKLRSKHGSANAWSDCVDLTNALRGRQGALNEEGAKIKMRQMKLLPRIGEATTCIDFHSCEAIWWPWLTRL